MSDPKKTLILYLLIAVTMLSAVAVERASRRASTASPRRRSMESNNVHVPQ
jgi:inner membrane protein involved in colicin E2 resistance